MKRFPFVLTILCLAAFAALAGLGVWQLQRLAWKQRVLSRIEALNHAPPRAINAVIAELGAGADIEYRRIAVTCAPPATPSPTAYRYALRDAQVGWRLLTACHWPGGPAGGGYDGVIIDRGLVERFTGAMAPAAGLYSEPVGVIGVLRAVGAKPMLDVVAPPASGVTALRVVDQAALVRLARASGLQRPLPYLLAAESESPPVVGLRPAALPQDVPNNHFIYALTWFALAGILAWFYGALLLRRLSGR